MQFRCDVVAAVAVGGAGGTLFVDSADLVIAFGAYRLDRVSGRLFRGDAPVPLRFKAFAVLEYLVLRPGRLVARDELLDALWPATHVTPGVLAGCIRELRRALDDRARGARFIETAHRRGYRFVASPVTSAPVLDQAGNPSDAELAALARRFAQAVAVVSERARRAGGGGSMHVSGAPRPRNTGRLRRSGKRVRDWENHHDTKTPRR